MLLEWGVLTVLNSICANGNNLKFVTVPWSDVQDSVRTEMVEYVREMMSSSGVSLPTRSIIGKRIKRYYRSQRHQAQIKADKEKRRRQYYNIGCPGGMSRFRLYFRALFGTFFL